MKKAISGMLLALVVALVGCKGGGVEKAMNDWKSQACACKDKKCVEDVKKKSDDLEKKYKDDFGKLSKEKQEALGKVMEEGEACLMKIEIAPE